MDNQKVTNNRRNRRKWRVRNRVRGTAERPRLSVFRSHRHMFAQLIDDDAGTTLVAVGTQDKDVKSQAAYGGNCDAAKAVGQTIARRALDRGISAICFDRGNYRYHGRVAALANAAREAGLKF